jgi:hypothetical protein
VGGEEKIKFSEKKTKIKGGKLVRGQKKTKIRAKKVQRKKIKLGWHMDRKEKILLVHHPSMVVHWWVVVRSSWLILMVGQQKIAHIRLNLSIQS